ncbi:proteolipid protein 2 [Rhineura floridana]|uniref:proteolipid protein 2 n=1 Tax=Rhineura floridana TaxID=261503 RepID=UPI002AC86A00|nr:proteolipid protein 2 [Rhineura floridana]
MEPSNTSKGCVGQCTSFTRTHKGAILLAEIIACILILICYGASSAPGYTTLPIFMMIYCIIIFIIFMLGLHSQITFIHWGWTDFLRALIGAISLFIISLIALIRYHDGPGIAAGVFGILTGILFGYDAYTILPNLRRAHTSAPTGTTEGI